MTSYIADSNAWISYFDKNPAFKALLEENDIKTPSLAVMEIVRVWSRRGSSRESIRRALDFVFQHSIILDLGFEQAAKAGALAVKEKMHLSDAIVYSYASPDEFVLTADPHFKGKPFVKLV